ncbi:ATP-dependent Clp protease proteolytic subunit [Hymenobacter negativus]|uniref:ATP-dependent Clp protease proteolytic subunit n=1 Tax=Hymenobacter negativus TaxID=2795026 RepID=UPI00397E7D56
MECESVLLAQNFDKTYQEIYDNSELDYCYWMRADEAKEYGLIDEVLEKKASFQVYLDIKKAPTESAGAFFMVACVAKRGYFTAVVAG